MLTPGATVTPPAATGAPDPNYGLKAVGPANTSALPPVEKAADAPDQVNEAAGKPQPATPAATPGKKTKKPVYDTDILKAMSQRVMVGDGAMGTQLQAADLSLDDFNNRRRRGRYEIRSAAIWLTLITTTLPTRSAIAKRVGSSWAS